MYHSKNPSDNPTGPYDPNQSTDDFAPLVPHLGTREPNSEDAVPHLPKFTLDELLKKPNLPQDEPIGVQDEAFLPLDDEVQMEDLPQFNADLPYAGPVTSETEEREPIRSILENFIRYEASAESRFAPLEPEVKAAIELMRILDKEGVPLSMYDKIIDWHIKHLGGTKKVTRKVLLNRLRDRYNMKDLQPYNVTTYLPHSKLYLKIPCHDFEAVLRDLLTAPMITDDDYLFFNDNPCCPPPPDHEWQYLEDINTGLSFRETYFRLIKPKPTTDMGRKKVLLPVIPYLDACVTGQFQNLSLEILKITLGIFKSKSRDKGCFWRNLGAVPKYARAKNQSRESILHSAHKDAKAYLTDSDDESIPSLGQYDSSDEEDDEEDSVWGKSTGVKPKLRRFGADFEVFDYIDGDDVGSDADLEDDDLWKYTLNPAIPDTNAQDFHCILKTILGSYKKVQDAGGIDWNLYYRGQVYYLRFIPFIVYVKGDGVEHDKHCAKYGSRTEGVKQLCRYCCCPNDKTDDPYGDWELKTKTMLTELIRKRKHKELKDLSQKFVWNAWYELRFGLHNDRSIHGASPMEIIHWMQLGQFKYSREMFFAQTGEGKLGDYINICATSMGPLFQRQSDKSFPRTKFTKGIMKGKLMAHEYSGLILVLAAALRSSRGRHVIMEHATTNKQKQNFQDERWVVDWILLLETQLQLLQWLKSPKISVVEATRMQVKCREYMELTRVVGKREEGMKHKTMNFHGTLHVADDMLNFGVPTNVDTKSDEMHHKDDKKSSKRTQKRPKTFEMQSLRQIEDKRIIEFGEHEANGRVRWGYYHGFTLNPPNPQQNINPNMPKPQPHAGKKRPNITLTGARGRFQFNLDDDWEFTLLQSRKKNPGRHRYPSNVGAAVAEMINDCAPYLEALYVYEELKLGGQRYRASPHFQGKPWYDWAMVGVLPYHIRCFVDLRKLPEDNNTPYKRGVYMIVEAAAPNLDPKEKLFKSDIFLPFVKVRNHDLPCHIYENQLRIMSVNEITGPACVIPDLDNTHPGAYLRVKPPSDWAKLFSSFIMADHTPPR